MFDDIFKDLKRFKDLEKLEDTVFKEIKDSRKRKEDVSKRCEEVVKTNEEWLRKHLAKPALIKKEGKNGSTE